MCSECKNTNFAILQFVYCTVKKSFYKVFVSLNFTLIGFLYNIVSPEDGNDMAITRSEI